MKKITIIPEKVTGFEADNNESGMLYIAPPIYGGVTDYVSDAYDYNDYENDYHFAEHFTHEPDAINYTMTLRDKLQSIQGFQTELEYACHRLEDCAELIKTDSTLSESDKTKLVEALESTVSSLFGLYEECDNPIADIQGALDAFGNLQLTE